MILLTGLITTALAYPELTGSADWLELALTRTEKLLQTAVYPDGLSTEQSTSYDIGEGHDRLQAVATSLADARLRCSRRCTAALHSDDALLR